MLKLGSLTLDSPVMQSPMAGCTDLPFRLIARKHGLELGFLEMIPVEAMIRETDDYREMTQRSEGEQPAGIQLVGKNPASFAEAARIARSMKFDLIDLNLGCPVPKITSKGGGSAILRKPKEAERIFLATVKAAGSIPVTVKLRTGYEDDSGKEALNISKIAEDSGIAALTVHGRTRAQRYEGKADWSIIRKVKKAVRIPVIGNGDIFSGTDAVRMRAETGCDAMMVGRGGLGNPWLYEQISAALENRPAPELPSLETIRKTLLLHFELEVRFFGEWAGLLRTRKIACWYFSKIPGVSHFRSKINRCVSVEEMQKLIEAFKPVYKK